MFQKLLKSKSGDEFNVIIGRRSFNGAKRLTIGVLNNMKEGDSTRVTIKPIEFNSLDIQELLLNPNDTSIFTQPMDMLPPVQLEVMEDDAIGASMCANLENTRDAFYLRTQHALKKFDNERRGYVKQIGLLQEQIHKVEEQKRLADVRFKEYCDKKRREMNLECEEIIKRVKELT